MEREGGREGGREGWREGGMEGWRDGGRAHMWSTVVKALPEEQMKFALNAALDVLPHNHNLKKNSPACTLCGENQSLLHVLNNCSSAMNLRHYNCRHDLVLQEFTSAIRSLQQPCQ